MEPLPTTCPCSFVAWIRSTLDAMNYDGIDACPTEIDEIIFSGAHYIRYGITGVARSQLPSGVAIGTSK